MLAIMMKMLILRMLYKVMMKSVNASYNDENAHLEDSVEGEDEV